MLYAAHNVSTRMFLKLTAVLLLLVGVTGSAFAANTGAPPQLVPYTINLLAGNIPAGGTGGFGGDGSVGSASTLSSPNVLAVDAVGNVYFPDTNNAVIREISAQTGVINTVAGVPPTGCTGTAACVTHTGCADGVPALRSPISSGVQGIAVDSYGNVYFSDSTQTISVIYRGGAQVAAFISLVNPAGVTTAGGVKEGYVYHVAGTISLATCAGTKSSTATATVAAVPAGDGNLALNSGATFGGISVIGLDSAGNIYAYDAGVNGTVRVINTQAQAQTFFNVKVQPGYIASIVNCSALTVLCPPGYGGSPSTVANTNVGQPAGGGVFNTPSTGNGQFFNVDAYGNLYEMGTKNETPGIMLAVAYAGGAPLAALINKANSVSGVTNVPGLTATAGAFYYLLQSITLRPSSIVADPFGNLYYQDNHYAQVYRIDANTVAYGASLLNYGDRGTKSDGGMFYEDRNNPATPAAPVFCFPVQGTTALTAPSLTGYQTTNNIGDGCPVIDADGPGSLAAVSGYGSTITDGTGNLLLADRSHQAIRKVYLNNVFPARTVGQPIGAVNLAGQQTLQVHFDQGNLPVQATAAPNVTTPAFSIAPGTTDFTISPISSQFTSAAAGAVTGLPTCSNLAGSVDSSLDCQFNVQFVPSSVGLRQAELVVTTANGSVYNYALTGIGNGGQLAIDGGVQSVVAATGLGNLGQIAVSQTGGTGLVGTVYIADPTNNRVISVPAGGGTQTTIGTGLKNPMGVAVDAAGNVYISDTGNNRIVEVSSTGIQTVLGGILAVGTPAYATPYTFKAPQGLAVDVNGNVYVADTGNAKVVMIPSLPVLGGATPLLQYPGAPTFKTPVSVALDLLGNVYVADTGAIQVMKIPAGGGDLQFLPPSGAGATLTGYGNVTRPSGVAVDAAGNVYISGVDASGAFQVFEAGAASGPSGAQFALNFAGLNFNGTAGSAFQGGAIALDAGGNVYVADSGNNRVLFTNRQSPTVPFGVVSQNQPAATTTLYVTNIGNQAVTIGSPFTNITTTTPPGGQAFTLTNTCSSVTTLAPGTHCTVTPSFLPTADGVQSATVAINGSSTQAITLTGSGQQPLAKIVLAVTSPASGPTVGQPATVTATLTQPNIPGNVPQGTVAFTYLIQGDGTTGSATATVSGSGTATLTLPTLLQGRRYTINATYNGDSLNSVTVATPLVFSIPGVPVTATANSISYTYGQVVPAISGTVTGITDSSVTYKFVTAATSSSAIGTYPITVVFSGGTYLNYGFPPVLTSAGAPAVAVESAAALTVKANSISSPYGAADLSYTSTVTGLVNGDQVAETYTPANSSILNVGTYPIVPTIVSPSAGNYNVTVTNGTLTVTPGATSIAVSVVAPSVLPTALSTDPVTIIVSTAVSGGKGTPTGSVTITDVFTPITSGAPGYGPTAAAVTAGTLPLVAGQAVYTPTSTTLGTHVYTVAYGGDSNFQASTTVAGTTLLVDNQDFTVSSTTNPIQIAPGIIPGGLATVAGEAAATPETATVTISSIQSFTGVVTLTCLPQNPTYVTCTLTPPTVTVPKPTTGTTNTITSVIAISTPATLPLNFQFSSELRKTGTTAVWAFLPFGVLAFCVRKRKRLSKALWMLIAMAAVSVGMSGCGANSVHFFTPVPAGPQTVTIFATGTSPTTNTVVTRSFTVTINIQ